MILLHGTKVQISREGVQSVWAQYYVDSYREVSEVPQGFGNTEGGNPLALTEINASQAEEGKQYVVTAKYEGLAEDALVKKIYSWAPAEAQEPIITNPNIKQLWVAYGATWDKDAQDIIWPKTIKAAKGGKETDNPILGTTSFISLGGTWSETEVVAEIPDNIWSGIWSIVDEVPGNLPTPPKRAWLVTMPSIEQRGACFSITRNWKLTGEMTEEKLAATRLIYTPIR